MNNPITAFDLLGLAYHISNLNPPSGLWQVTIVRNVAAGDNSLTGYHARYLPEDGKHGQPACPCSKDNIILVQAIKDALDHPEQFDVNPMPAHGPDVPIPEYQRILKPLTIEDAPNVPSSPRTSGNWDIEDCAVCRTHPDSQTTDDQVLGCMKFRFHRTSTTEADIDGSAVESKPASLPGDLWNKALSSWQTK